MIKFTAATALAALLATGGAFAQSTPSTTSPPTTPPAATPPSPGAPSSPAPSVQPSASPTTAPAGQLWYVAADTDMRASKLIGTTVRNAANESIGDVNEVVLDPSGKVAAVIIGVGGFLGIGEREVAVSYSALKVARDTSGNAVLTVDATKDSLRAAPAWTWKKS